MFSQIRANTFTMLAAALGLGLAAPAMALSVDAAGQVTDWGNLTPFSQANGTSIAGGISSFRGNNVSAVTYPGIGAIPSPGGTTGEKFDLEEVHIRNVGDTVQILLVSSSLFERDGYFMGDFLLDTDGDTLWDMGLVTRNHDGVNAGQLYDGITTSGLQVKSGSYYNYPSVVSQIGNGGAAFVTSGLAIGGTSPIVVDTHDYAGESGTKFAEFTFTVPSDLDGFNFQLAWGCGNDVIRGFHVMDRPPTPPTPGGAVPEMATALLSLMGLTSLGLRRRR